MKKDIQFIVLAVLCLFLSIKVHAIPPIKIVGAVSDQKGNPLQGATVKIKENNATVFTNNKGAFTITAPADTGTLIVSFLGYQTKEINFSPVNPGPFNITLVGEESALKEVEIVSTGYQNIPKERATGSFAQPNKEMFDARVSSGVLSRLEGITSGLIFNSGLRGQDNPNISVRGLSTIYANDQPLIVVDNFPYNGNINDLNPQDVESINILKDAAAASIWGVKAGNGVIVITTKKGKLNQAIKVSANANITVGERPDLYYDPNFIASPDYIEIQQYLFRKGKYNADLVNKISYPSIPAAVEIMQASRSGAITSADSIAQIGKLKNIDIRDELLRHYYVNPVNQQYAFNISSGTQKSSYYFSTGYDRTQTNLKNSYNDRLTLNFLNTYLPLKNLEFTTHVNYVLSTKNSGSSLNLSNATSVNGIYYPYVAFADEDGKHLTINRGYSRSYLNNAVQNDFLNWDYNPLDEFDGDKSITRTTDARIFAGVKYTFLKGLNIEGKYQYQKYNADESSLQGLQSYSTRDLINRYSILTTGKVTNYNIPVGDIFSLSNTLTSSNNFRGQLSYSLTGIHSVNAIAGIEFIEYLNHSNANRLYGYDGDTDNFTSVNYTASYSLNPSGSGSIPLGTGITNGIDRYRSAFVSASYTYDSRYTASASARQDGSNYFGVATNQKTVPLWSAGLKWHIDREKFFSQSWLSMLQLRATYGFNGNLNKSVTGITTFRYNTNATWTNLPYATISNLGNPELRWEKNGISKSGT